MDHVRIGGWVIGAVIALGGFVILHAGLTSTTFEPTERFAMLAYALILVGLGLLTYSTYGRKPR